MDAQAGPFRDFNELTRGAEKVEGLFTLHRKGDHLYAELPMHQLNQPLLVPITIARGIGRTGMPVGDEDMVLVFRRVGDRIQVVRRNIHYKASPTRSLDKSVKQNYTDSVLMALPILAINPMRRRRGGDRLLRHLLHRLRPARARRARPRPDQLGQGQGLRQQHGARGRGDLHRRPRGPMRRANDGVADHRGITLVIHYSLIRAPEYSGYRPRMADDRVGHFLSATKDFGVPDADTNFVRMINRWRLEKANPHAKLSPPKKQIVWYVEDTVPIEYRPYVEEGIREWNKAFEKIGFKDAIAVRWEEAGRDEFDPEDTNYCTFRWVTSDMGYARVVPAGQPDDRRDDRRRRHLRRRLHPPLEAAVRPPDRQQDGRRRRRVVRPRWPWARSSARSWPPRWATASRRPATSWASGASSPTPDGSSPEVIPADQNLLAWELARNAARSSRGFCELQFGMQRDLALAAIAMADGEADAGRRPGGRAYKRTSSISMLSTSPETLQMPMTTSGRSRPPNKPQPKDELPEEFLGQAIKRIVMHEVGHSLGLRHNFKASTMLTADQLNDTAITHAKGLVGSVMDYCPINIAPKGKKQGDYYSTTLGPYDYWAIEYAYKPVDGDEASELKKIAARAPEHDLVYATDEDAVLNDDPYVNRWDLGSDPAPTARAGSSWPSSSSRTWTPAWSRTATPGRGPGARSRSCSSSGATARRSPRSTSAASRSPATTRPTRTRTTRSCRSPGAKQRECLKFLVDSILSDGAFRFSPALLRRLGTERWHHWGSSAFGGASVDISVLERVLAIQKIVLSHCLSPQTLARLQNQQLQADPNADPLRMEELFRSLSDGVWSDLDRLGGRARRQGRQGRRSRPSAATSSASISAGCPAWSSAARPRRPTTGSSTSSSPGAARRRSRPMPGPWPGCTSRRSPAGSARCSRPPTW